jgi:transcriptional regulator with XRE-family HTH domain
LTNLEAALQVGVTEKTVWRWRKGQKPPRPRYARRLAEEFGGEWTDYKEAA